MKTKILPINFNDDLETMIREDEEAIGIEKMSITYTQPADTWSSSDDIQEITITTQCATSVRLEDIENQDGFYFDITIPEGQRWSINDEDSLKALIEDFKKRLYQVNEFNYIKLNKVNKDEE